MNQQGRKYWRSLEHLEGTPQVRELAYHEFAGYDPQEMLTLSPLTRRRFMQLAAAATALATLTGCRRWPEEKLAPYTSNPHNRLPGVPEQYATIYEIDGVGAPLLITSFDGRPIKIEGNPTHPFSATAPGVGAADAHAQASILDMYDPDRSRSVLSGGSASDWNTFVSALTAALAPLADKQGDGLAILAEPMSGPSAQRLTAAVQAKFPKTTWCFYAPLSSGSETAAINARPMLHLDKAKVIISFDADLLGSHPAHVRYASDWAAGRRTADSGAMSRLYIAETAFSTTGSVADERLPIRPSRLGSVMNALARAVGVSLSGKDDTLAADEQAFVLGAAKDLSANSGAGVIAVGSHLPPEFHAVGLAINAKIGANGATVDLLDAPAVGGVSIGDLAKQMKSNGVNTLVILGGNPAYDAPSDLDFAGSLKSVPHSIHLSLYANETTQLCSWHVPKAHYLEAWGDARAWDGTISVCQPLIQPLFDGKTGEQLLAWIAGENETDSDAIVRRTFAANSSGGDTDQAFRVALNDGIIKGTSYSTITPPSPATAPLPPAPVSSTGFELRFLADSRVYDGRFAGNGWLQEMPDPLTKLVWDNAALISVKDAQALSVDNGDLLSIKVNGRSLTIVAYILPGQPVGVIGLPLGYGRTAAGHIGTDVGFNTYQLRGTDALFTAASADVSKTGDTYELAMTQNHQLLDDVGAEGREDRVGKDKYQDAVIIRETTFDEYTADPKLFQKNEDGSLRLQLFDPPQQYNEPHAWGMAIDMSSCIGCHACVVACQAENNIPVVGKDQVIKNRQMHWIRIDRYFKGDVDEPEVVYQPLTCQQCENAPCEQVCPVGATEHDTEGINVMVYNRCVGTRYCSNNCPYKVRRFNYLDFHSQDPRHDKYPPPFLGIPDQQQLQEVNEIKRMVFNPEVTVRMRGVMEKCTFCVQRIHNTQIVKRNAGEELADGDIVTACQQSCPTQAIIFGDLNDPNSRVSQLHRNNRAYDLLETLNTRPRNRYLAKISNPGTA
jgi:MoCo/4Fe-4S cofactor protein with predicted Tat translocation signal